MKFKDTEYGDLTGQYFKGDLYVSDMGLTSLEGAPKTVTGIFSCKNNNLTSLKHCPSMIGGNFDCSNNQLTTLEGSPRSVGTFFNCSNNQLVSLKGISLTVRSKFDFSNNPNKHLDEELKVRKRNQKLSDDEIKEKMMKKGYVEHYASEEVKDMFMF